MKGMIFNQLENMVRSQLGDGAWDALLDQTELKTKEGYFVGPRSYPDADLFALVAAASRVTGKPVDELITAFGRYLFAGLATAYPSFIKPGMTAKTFLMTVDRVIHIEVHKLHPDATLPSVRYEDPGDGQLVLLYSSPRKLCDLAVGLVDGVATYFGESVTQTHPRCMKRGDEVCRLECTFS